MYCILILGVRTGILTDGFMFLIGLLPIRWVVLSFTVIAWRVSKDVCSRAMQNRDLWASLKIVKWYMLQDNLRMNGCDVILNKI